MMPFPQRYYAPRRIRDSYKPRLEAAGLWHVNVKEEEKLEKSFDHTRMTREYKRTVKKTFDKAQVSYFTSCYFPLPVIYLIERRSSKATRKGETRPRYSSQLASR